MRSTALAFKDEDDEVPVSSQEVLEANVAAIRTDLNELKTDFRAAVTRIDSDIKAAVSKLEGEIRAMSAKAEKELKEFGAGIERQISEMRQDIREMRGEDKTLRDKIDKNHETLSAKYDVLNAKIDKHHEATQERFATMDRKTDRMDTKLNLLIWLVGGAITVVPTVITVGKAFGWF
jgi:chromosome segregation ATPase